MCRLLGDRVQDIWTGNTNKSTSPALLTLYYYDNSGNYYECLCKIQRVYIHTYVCTYCEQTAKEQTGPTCPYINTSEQWATVMITRRVVLPVTQVRTTGWSTDVALHYTQSYTIHLRLFVIMRLVILVRSQKIPYTVPYHTVYRRIATTGISDHAHLPAATFTHWQYICRCTTLSTYLRKYTYRRWSCS
jgi:hypothetical protein